MPTTKTPSVRAQVVTRRSYNRPLDEAGTVFETWWQTIDRVIAHQRNLWEEAQGGPLTPAQVAELEELRGLYLSRKSLPAGRTLWLGGTDLVKRRQASNFNCSFLEVRTVHDVVDAFWLLLQGCGVGFRPITGSLSGFTRKMEVEVIRSTRTIEDGKGRPTNDERYDPEERVWWISVGDSAEAWAKAMGKVVASKYPARKVVFDLREIRAAGTRLKGYGWLCSGDGPLAIALAAIGEIMSKRSGKLLSKEDIWDIVNWLGTVLSSRRSAQIGMIDHGDPEARAIATRKPPGFDWPGSPLAYRSQSNNAFVFHDKPTNRQVRDSFELMVVNGGSEPSFVNAVEAKRRAPWFSGLNPCGEILLANKGFCNLVENDVAAFADDDRGLHRAVWLNARANYRQTLVDLRDGILQDAWHQTNEYLRLCGVGLMGLVRRPDLTHHDLRQLRNTAVAGAYAMADELGHERPKNVTTVKPGGTIPKVADTTEGASRPLGEFIFNNVNFSRHDPLVPMLVEAGYRVMDHPYDATSVLITLPVAFSGVPQIGGFESAVAQLERYRMMQDAWSDQNTSNTISYDPSEIPALVKWFDKHWDSYVGVSFMLRNDATKTAKDLGYAYLPQEVVTREVYEAYASSLAPVNIEDVQENGSHEVDAGQECPGGMCPTR